MIQLQDLAGNFMRRHGPPDPHRRATMLEDLLHFALAVQALSPDIGDEEESTMGAQNVPLLPSPDTLAVLWQCLPQWRVVTNVAPRHAMGVLLNARTLGYSLQSRPEDRLAAKHMIAPVLTAATAVAAARGLAARAADRLHLFMDLTQAVVMAPNLERLSDHLADSVLQACRVANAGVFGASTLAYLWRCLPYVYRLTSLTHEAAFAVFCEAVSMNVCEATVHVAHCLILGRGAAPDWPAAVALLRAACVEGSTLAHGLLGECLWFGLGVARNGAESARVWQAGAAAGDLYATARCHYFGLGVAADLARAERFLRATLDVWPLPAAQNLLWDCVAKDGRVRVGVGEATKWPKAAAEHGYAVSQYLVGNLYEVGAIFSHRALPDALFWYQQAAHLGFSSAQFAVGHCLAHGDGTEVNFVEALQWYKRAAAQGVAEALYAMGDFFETGKGMRHASLLKARLCFAHALRLGFKNKLLTRLGISAQAAARLGYDIHVPATGDQHDDFNAIARLNRSMAGLFWTYALRGAFPDRFNARLACSRVAAQHGADRLPHLPAELWEAIWQFMRYELWNRQDCELVAARNNNNDGCPAFADYLRLLFRPRTSAEAIQAPKHPSPSAVVIMVEI